MACKSLGVKVNEFALGMGPAFFKKRKGETLYSLRIFPIGGFCAMEGEDEDSDDSRAFNRKSGWVKAIILAAGSFMNVLLAIIILSGIIFYIGTSLTTTISEVTEGSPAQAAGILPGDKITSIEGVEIKAWEDVINVVSKGTSEQFGIQIERDGSQMILETGVMTGEDGRRVIGIRPEVNRNPVAAIAGGAQMSYIMIKNMVDLIGQLFTGGVPATELTGPVGIAYIVDDTAKTGIQNVFYLVALISLNLAIVNMLPFPALDGGRLLFLVIRKITGKAVSDKVEGRIHLVGMMLLFALMIYVTWNDIGRFVLGAFG